MDHAETESVLTLALMAGFADGVKTDAERAEFKRIAESLPKNGIQPAALYHRVLLKQVSLPQAASALRSLETRQLAYELAVCICDADGSQSVPEKDFLKQLRDELRLEAASTSQFERAAEELTAPPVFAVAASVPTAPAPTVDAAAVDKMILNYAILNGALELLPESLATMAIVPMQMKMVYRVGKLHGHELDRGHIKELAAAAGLGLTSQVVEGYARKLLSGLLGKVGGGMMKTIGKQAASSVMSFATTWALGRLAHQYYAGGRKLSAVELRQLFGSLTEQARGLHGTYASAIREKAGSLDISQLLPMIRGQNN